MKAEAYGMMPNGFWFEPSHWRWRHVDPIYDQFVRKGLPVPDPTTVRYLTQRKESHERHDAGG